jgi:hypothetical protein
MVWDEAARDDDLIVQHLSSSESAGIDNELEVVRARARAMASHINRDLAYANVQAVIARLYNSIGYDIVPREDEERPLAELANAVQVRYAEYERSSFSPRAELERPVVAIGEISGVRPRIAKLVGDGANRVLAGGHMKSAGGGADLLLDMRLQVERVQEGRRTVRIEVGARRTGAFSAPALREFRTTLSDPVDDEQWRTLGEGAAYRVAADLANTRITRPALRIEPALDLQKAPAGAAPAAATEPLDLRLEQRIAPR